MITRKPAKPGSPVTKFVIIFASNAPKVRIERFKNIADLYLRDLR